jgi:hypothetical protein
MTGLQPTIATGRSVVAQAQSRPPRTWRRSQSVGRPTWRYRTGNPERLPALSSLPPPRALIGREVQLWNVHYDTGCPVPNKSARHGAADLRGPDYLANDHGPQGSANRVRGQSEPQSCHDARPDRSSAWRTSHPLSCWSSACSWTSAARTGPTVVARTCEWAGFSVNGPIYLSRDTLVVQAPRRARSKTRVEILDSA